MFLFFRIVMFVCCLSYVSYVCWWWWEMHWRIGSDWSIVSSYVWCEIWFIFLINFFPWKYHSSILDGLFSFIYFSIFSWIYHSSIFVFSLFSNHSFFVQWTLLPQLLVWTLKRERKREELQYYACYCVLWSFVYNVLYDV